MLHNPLDAYILNPGRDIPSFQLQIEQPVQIEELDESPKILSSSESSGTGSPVNKRAAKSSQCIFSASESSTDDENTDTRVALHSIENFDSTPRLNARKSITPRDLLRKFQN